MCKLLREIVFASILILKQVIATEINVLDLVNKDSANNNKEMINYIEYKFGISFSCQFIYRHLVDTEISKSVRISKNATKELNLFYLHNPWQNPHFTLLSWAYPFINIRLNQLIYLSSEGLRFNNSIDFYRNKKLATFYNNEMFDGNWHKIAFYYDSGYVQMAFDCSEPSREMLRDTFEDILFPPNQHNDYAHLYYELLKLSHDIDIQKFIIYDELRQKFNCEDLENTKSSNITNQIKFKSSFSAYEIYGSSVGSNYIRQKQASDFLLRIAVNSFNHKEHLENLKCVVSNTVVKRRETCEGDLIFEDTFFEPQLDRTTWEYEVRIPLDSEDAEFVSYQDYPENCFIEGDALILKPTFLDELPGFNESSIRLGELNLGSNCTVLIDDKIECYRKAQYFRILPPVVSAKIRTKKSFSFRYGRIDVRAKLPRGDWIFPQIFLEPLNSDYGTGRYKSGQMRIAYIRANEYLLDKNLTRIDGARLSGGVVLQVGELTRDRYLKHSLQSKHLSDDYHVYTMIWTNESITLLLDGKEYGSIDGGFQDIPDIPHAHLWKRGEFMAPFDQEFYISLGVSVGGVSDFPDGSQTGKRKSPKPWQNTNPKSELHFWNNINLWQGTWRSNDISMKVDYVRVWAL